MAYKYVAYREDGTVVRGTIEAASEALAKETIVRSGHNLLSIQASGARPNLSNLLPSLFGIKTKHMIAFTRRLATLVERGIPLVKSLRLLGDQAYDPRFKEVISLLVQDVQQGVSLADAAGKHPEAFPPVYVQMLIVSERTGNLEAVLRQAADYVERENLLLKKVARAMAYPAFILVLASGVAVILTVFTLPPLLEIFSEFEADLPLVTRLVVGLVDFVSDYKLILAAALAAIVIAVILLTRGAGGRKRLDRLVLTVPFVREIVTMREMAHFTRTLSMLLHAGLPMHDAMETTAVTARNSVVRETLSNTRQDIMMGASMSHAMRSSGFYPKFLVEAVQVGEQGGTLSQDLSAMAEWYEDEVNDKVNNLTSMLGPVLLLAVGLVVGFLAVSVILPMYTIMGAI